MTIRFAQPDDSGALLKIYGQYIATSITFEYQLPTEREFSERIAAISGFYPYLLCEVDGAVVGYAYAAKHRERAAYQWGAELSVYLDQNFTSRGLGKKLYLLLIEILKLQGLKTVYGGVTHPNAKSEALHLGLGFKILGVFHNAGYKDGQWRDVIWYEKEIAPYDPAPLPIQSVASLPQGELERIIASSIFNPPPAYAAE